MRPYLLLLGGSITLTAIEFWALIAYGLHPGQSQFLLGTLPFTFALIGIAIETKARLPLWMAALGHKESMATYLYHPVFVVLLLSLWTHTYTFWPSVAVVAVPSMPIWIASTLLTIGSLLTIRLIFPTLRERLDGALPENARAH